MAKKTDQMIILKQGVQLVVLCASLITVSVSCHTPLKPETESPLRDVESVMFGGIYLDTRIGTVNRVLDETQWFRDRLEKVTLERLKQAESFSLAQSQDRTKPPVLEELRGDGKGEGFSSHTVRESLGITTEPFPENQTIFFFYFRLSDGTIKDNLILKNRGTCLIVLPSKQTFIAKTSESINYQPHLPVKMPSFEDMARFVFMAGLSEANWKDILVAEQMKESTVLPIPVNKLVDLIEHRVEAARGTQQYGWIETMKMADWSKPLQFKQFGIAFVYWLICCVVGVLLAAWIEGGEDRPGQILALGAGIGWLYFFYFMLAALF